MKLSRTTASLAPLFPTMALSQSSSGFTCSGASSYNASITSLGCYPDSTVRTLTGGMITVGALNTPQYCANLCGSHGFIYAGVEYSTQCFCGSTIENGAQPEANDNNCNMACSGDSSLECGGNYQMNLYQVSNPAPTITPILGFTPVCQTSPLCSSQACNTSLSVSERVAALVDSLTTQEKIDNLIDAASGSTRLGLPAYEWWSEALHGVAGSIGVSFNTPNGTNFSYATSFPMPITLSAAFDDNLVSEVASTIGKEARAFANNGRAGFDFWTPNINPFRDPRWGRGPETPGEDAFRIQNYVRALVPGLQGAGGTDKQIISCCKHYAVYDVETGRHTNDYNPDQHDLASYYLAPFQACVRDADVGQIMCSYNAVDGVPSCANQYLLDTVLGEWGFRDEPYRYVGSDCGAIEDIYDQHNFTNSAAAAAAVAINAGTDLECGTTYLSLNVSLAENMTTTAVLDRALTRLYNALFTVGYFDGSDRYGSLGWSDVSTGAAQSLAYEAAVRGATLLKNEKSTLPLSRLAIKKIALIGPWANATVQMQGNYYGNAPYLVSPLAAFQTALGADAVLYAEGTAIDGTNTTGFADATAAAQAADAILFLGGLDNSVESESLDRTTLVWPGNQLDLVSALAEVGKPLVVVQFGGGQIDDTALLNDTRIGAILWAGYPGQDGGAAVADVVFGVRAPAGRLPVTQYPASYADDVEIVDPDLRPDAATHFPGRTYKWYDGTPILPFGYGLHYTTFNLRWASQQRRTYSTSELVKAAKSSSSSALANAVAFSVSVAITNTGRAASDYSGLLFLSTRNAGPAPYPNKWLASYGRVYGLATSGSGKTRTLELPVTLGSLARVDDAGNTVLYPGDYELQFDWDARLTASFSLTGAPVTLDTLPTPLPASEYNYTVPVNIEPPTYQGSA